MLYRQPILALIIFLSLPTLIQPWCKQTFFPTSQQIRAMATSLGGRYLAVAHVDNYVRFYYGTDYVKAGEYNVGFAVNVIRFSNDGYYVAIGGVSNTVTIINAYQPFGFNTTVSPNVGSIVVGMDFSNSSARFVACGGNTNGAGKINLMNVLHTAAWTNAISSAVSMNPASNSPNDCRISPLDGKIIVDTSSKIQLYDAGLTTNSPTTWNANAGIAFSKLVFNPLTTNVIFIDPNGNQTYSLSTATSGTSPVALSSPATSAFSAVDFSSNGKYIATGGAGKIMYVYDSSRNVVARWQTTGLIKSIAFSRQSPNMRLFAGDAGGEILVLSFNCSALTCPTDYYLDPTGCKFCGDAISKCIQCSNQTICQKCVDGYFVNPNTFQCDACTMLGCLTCSDLRNCTQCHSGFYSATANNLTTCKRCAQGTGMQGCAICNASDTCIACNNDYYLDTVTTPTTPKCKLCSNISNCLKCNNSTVCIQCIVGFYKNGNTCSACNLNCLSCEASSTNCTQCARGWYVNMPTSYTCTRCQTGCLSCNNTNFCFECENGMYQKTDGSCATCIFPCTLCEDDTVCYVCSEGYFLSGTTCIPCINNCATCNSTACCTTCLPGFYNFTGNTCKGCIQTYRFCQYCTQSACQFCQPGYFLNSSTLCQSCSDKMFKCERCTSDTSCQSCIEGFYLTTSTGNASCQSCSTGCQTCIDSGDCRKCFKQYYLDTNLDCLPCTGNCLQCSDSSTCEICDEGYYLDGTTCKLCKVNITNCLNCFNGTVCVDCQIEYYLDSTDTKCKKCQGNCLTCDESKCMSCNIGYYLTTATPPACSLCSQSCTECTSATTCTSCKSGFYLDSSTCKNCSLSRHCQTCSLATCTSCLNGYFLDNTISPLNNNCTLCLSKIEGCLSCNATNYCFECDYGYFRDGTTNLCVSCTQISGCESCSSAVVCLGCGQGFYLNASTNKCQECKIGCSTCDSAGNCFTCSPAFFLNSTYCLPCQGNIQGCSLCSASTTCTQCTNGYYLQSTPTIQCNLCRKSLIGCLYCNSSSICTKCQPGFYLESTTDKCETCEKNMAGCEICSSANVCLDCEVGYHLATGGLGCTMCVNSIAGCLVCNDGSTCVKCKTGFYLGSDNKCHTCFTQNSGCQSCSSTASGIICSQCSSGFTLSPVTSLCSPCTTIGCQLCDQTNPSICITCDSMYFMSSSTCTKCNSVLQGCNECSSSSQCITCDVGYYLQAGKCKLCQDVLGGCSICSISGVVKECTQCKSSYVLDSVIKECVSCSQVMEGCTYCVNDTECVSCSNGYFKDSTTGKCRSCTEQEGCILCANQSSCEYCSPSYFLDHTLSKCIKCSSSLQFCITCLQSTRCLSCQSGYMVNQKFVCQQITVTGTTKPDGVKLITEYINKQTLTHTLMVANDQYSNVGYDLTGACTLYLTDYSQLSGEKKIMQVQLVVKDVKWVSPTKIKFYTNNPTSLTAEKMGLVRRMLESGEGQMIEIIEKINQDDKLMRQRLLADDSSASSMANFKVSLQMSQQAVNAILPNVYQTGDLVLDYSLDQPQFYTSYLKSQSQSQAIYSYFGYAITGVIILNFIIKTYKLSHPQHTHHSTGEIIPHILALKSIFLFQYPITQEFYYFCYGFMAIDLPWMNAQIGAIFGDQADYVPKQLVMYFLNLNLASTYLLGLAAAIGLFAVRFIISKNNELARQKYTQLIYCIFVFGMTFAGSLALQGAKFNPLQKISLNGLFYIIGIIVYFAVFIEMLYSVHKTKQNFFRVRIFIKATLLSIAHLNPIILVSIAIILDVLLVILQYVIIEKEVPWGKLWLANHLLLDIALILAFLLPNSLLSLYSTMAIVGVVTLMEILLNIKIMAYCQEKHKIQKSLKQKQANRLEHVKMGFAINESLETFIDDKDNKFDFWNAQFTGEQKTLNEIAAQDERVDQVKKHFQQNVQTRYTSFIKGSKQQFRDSENDVKKSTSKDRVNKRLERGRKDNKAFNSKESEDQKIKFGNPFRIQSSSSSPTDESAPSVEQKKKPKGHFVSNNRQKKKLNILS